MPTFAEDTYILGVWFVRHDERLPVHDRWDWMATVFRTPDSATWHMEGRAAHHVSEEVGPGAPPDEKHWFDATLNGTEEEVIAQMEQAATAIGTVNHIPVNTVLVQGDVCKMVELLRSQPWCHMDVPA